MYFFRLRASCLHSERCRLIGFLLLMACVTSCATTSPTQRRQLIFTNEQEELALAEVQYGKLLDTVVVNYDAQANHIVRTVGQRLARVAAKSNYLWEFVVIDAPDAINVWVLPGGKVGVSTGLFPAVQDEAGLAIVVAHAMAHALARHQSEKATRDVLVELSTMGTSFAPGLVQQTFSLGTNLGLILPFGRVQEEEADYLGLLLAAKAGYDPAIAAAVWDRVRYSGGTPAKPTEFLVAHPDYDTRGANLQKWLNEAIPYYQQTVAVPPARLPTLEQIERPVILEKTDTKTGEERAVVTTETTTSASQ
ncbi:MAG: M48 family metallopeptidase [Deltaproteobacteria bacterium]|nr:M48 family metallopeptidase [Deltaproteobacteria bacterium]